MLKKKIWMKIIVSLVLVLGLSNLAMNSTNAASEKSSVQSTKTAAYVKNLGKGTWKAGKDLKPGRYIITAKSGSGNIVIGMGTDRFVNEVLSSKSNGYSVTKIATNIKSGDKIKISGLKKVTFTKVSSVRKKTLYTGHWTAGADLKPGRYTITAKSGTGNLVIGMGTDRFVNEVLTAKDEGFGVTKVTTDIKSGDKINISSLNHVSFKKVSHVKKSTLYAGHWTVGKDLKAGTYKMTTPKGSGNLVIYRGKSLLVNEILSAKKDSYSKTSVTKTLKNGDKIDISGLNKVIMKKK